MKLSPTIKRILAISVLVVTIGVFAYYLNVHPEIIRQLGRTSPWLLALLILGYSLFTVALAFVQLATLKIIKVRMPASENLLLTSYSSIANFFGPLQSGPGVRLAYLKARYHINIKSYVIATFIYYAFFALISGFMLSAGVLQWWQTLLVLSLIGAGCWFVIRRKQRSAGSVHGFKALPIIWLGLATIAQLLIISLVYFAELRSVNPDISYGQAFTYTGAANFALFVSVTPGAIGFRESFVLFTQQLHHIAQHDVLAASVIDRASNVLFLGILFVATLGFHAKQRFNAVPPSGRSDVAAD